MTSLSGQVFLRAPKHISDLPTQPTCLDDDLEWTPLLAIYKDQQGEADKKEQKSQNNSSGS